MVVVRVIREEVPVITGFLNVVVRVTTEDLLETIGFCVWLVTVRVIREDVP